MGVAMFLVINLVIGLGALSLLFGTFETLFGKPKLTILKPSKGANFFAFGFKWNSAKDPAAIDFVRVRLFNPFGKPTQVEITRSYEPKSRSFGEEVDLGQSFVELLGAENFDFATLQVEIASSKDGVTFQFDMKGPAFKKLLATADKTTAQFIAENKLNGSVKASKPPIDIPIRSFIADTVPGKGAQLAISTNPAFAAAFAPAAGAGGAAAPAAAAVPNFTVAKVWIEPGCIVCNACEDIYKEVFEVLADTCIIRPGAPLDDGLRMQEAAEACPVEVIKFTRAS